jgi:hypothetical protein
VEADYGVTRDSMLFGIITKISGRSFVNGPGEDDTFSFRFRTDPDELNVHTIRGLATGSFKRMAGRHTKASDDHAEPPCGKAGVKVFKK